MGWPPSNPTELASFNNSPEGLALDNANAYVVGTGMHLRVIPKDGSMPSQHTLPSSSRDRVLADGDFVYTTWTLNDTMYATHKQAGTTQPFVTQDGFNELFGSSLAADATSIYWLTTSGFGEVNRVDKDGNNQVELATDLSGPTDMVLTTTHVYWTNWVDEDIKRVPKAGGEVEVVAEPFEYPWSIDHVPGLGFFFTDRGTVSNSTPTTIGAVYRLSEDFATTTTLADNLAGPTGLDADNTHVYFTNFFGGTVMRVPVGGGAIETLATNQDRPTEIVVDDDAVYWINEGGENLMIMAK